MNIKGVMGPKIFFLVIDLLQIEFFVHFRIEKLLLKLLNVVIDFSSFSQAIEMS